MLDDADNTFERSVKETDKCFVINDGDRNIFLTWTTAGTVGQQNLSYCKFRGS